MTGRNQHKLHQLRIRLTVLLAMFVLGRMCLSKNRGAEQRGVDFTFEENNGCNDACAESYTTERIMGQLALYRES